MAENVVALPGHQVPTFKGEPVPHVVHVLREALAEAESGNLRSVAIAGIYHDGTDAPMSSIWMQWEAQGFRGLYWATARLMRAIEREDDN